MLLKFLFEISVRKLFKIYRPKETRLCQKLLYSSGLPDAGGDSDTGKVFELIFLKLSGLLYPVATRCFKHLLQMLILKKAN